MVKENPTTPVSQRPYTCEYYYKARWGYAEEFWKLFLKNHWPVLEAQLRTGRFLSVTACKPRFHTTEEGRWDYRVTIVFKDLEAAHDAAIEKQIKTQLFPDQAALEREEQRRFDILIAHWDTPIEDVALDPM